MRIAGSKASGKRLEIQLRNLPTRGSESAVEIALS